MNTNKYVWEHIVAMAPRLSMSTLPQIPFNVPQSLMSYGAMFPVGLANKLADTATNNYLRVFLYNVLSENGWANGDFKQFVDTAFRILLVRLNENPGIANNPPLLDKVTDDCITLYACKLYMDFPNLQNAIPQIYQTCYENVQLLNNIMEQAMAAEQFMAGYNPNMGGNRFPQMGPSPMMNPGAGPMYNRQPNPPMYPQNTMGGAGGYRSDDQHPLFNRYGNMSHGSPQNTTPRLATPPQHRSPVRQSDHFQNAHRNYKMDLQPQEIVVEPFEEEFEPMKPTSPNVEIVSEKDWVPTPENPYKMLITKSQFKTYKRVNGVVFEYVEDLPMDRQQHEGTINIAGKRIPLDNMRIQKTLQDAKNLELLTAQDIIEARKEKPNKDILKNVVEYLEPEMETTVCLEAAIINGKMEQYSHELIDNTNVYRAFVTHTIPYITGQTADDEIINNINQCNRFTQISSVLKSAVEKELKKSNGDSYRKLYFYHEINKAITDIINDFLRNNLSLGVKIGDFIEDINDLYRHFKNNYASNYIEAYDTFELEVMKKGIFMNLSEESLQEAKDSVFRMTDGPLGVGVSIIPLNYSLTFVGVSNDDLKLSFEGDIDEDIVLSDRLSQEQNALLISELATPMLYSLAVSCHEQAESIESTVAKHLMITKDGVVYQLHKGYLMPDAYLISLYKA